jgi:hypothetical protein
MADTFSLHSNNSLKKLENLKAEVDNLNLERALLVERLIKRSQTNSISNLDMSFTFEKKIEEINKKEDSIIHFAANFKEKVRQHIAMNSKLMNLDK